MRRPHGSKPVTALFRNAGGAGEGLHVVYHGRAAQITFGHGKWRAVAGAATLAFERFDQGGFLAADIGAGTEMDFDVEGKPGLAENVFTQRNQPSSCSNHNGKVKRARIQKMAEAFQYLRISSTRINRMPMYKGIETRYCQSGIFMTTILGVNYYFICP